MCASSEVVRASHAASYSSCSILQPQKQAMIMSMKEALKAQMSMRENKNTQDTTVVTGTYSCGCSIVHLCFCKERIALRGAT